MAAVPIPSDEKKKIAGLFKKLREAARTRSCADVARHQFTARMGRGNGCSGTPTITAQEVSDMVKLVVKRSKLRAAHRKQVDADIQALHEYTESERLDVTELSMSDVPSHLVGSLAVNFISACEGAAADAEEELLAIDKDIQDHLARTGANPDRALASELSAYASTRGAAHALCIAGQPLSKATRQKLVEALEAQNAIRILHLHDCGLRDTDMSLLLPILSGMQHLRVLSLPYNVLSHDTLGKLQAALAETHAFPSLQALDLTGNDFPHAAAKQLQKTVSQRFLQNNVTLKRDPWLSQATGARGATGNDVRVLCLDGGLARTIAQVEVLMELQHLNGSPLDDTFDLIVGSGFGAIVAAALRLRRPLDAIRDTLLQICEQVFHTMDYSVPWAFEAGYRSLRNAAWGDWYPSHLLLALIRGLLGAEGPTPCMKDVAKPLQIVASRASGVGPGCPLEGQEVCLRSYETSAGLPKGVFCQEQGLAEACLAACSTPTFFAPAEVAGVGRCVDGCASHANPALLALSEVLQQVPLQDVVLVSVGCGVDASPHAASFSSLYDALSRHGVDPLALRLAPVQKPHACLASLSDAMKFFRYHRLDPAPSRPHLHDFTSTPYDECHREALGTVSTAAKDWFLQHDPDKIRTLVEILKQR